MTSLAERYGAVVCDLDGVVYVGREPVPHAVDALSRLEVPVVYATNNASRTPVEVAEHLGSLGLACDPEQVVTSSEAAAWLLGDHVGRGERVLAVGGPGVASALEAAGFVPVPPEDAEGRPAPAAVVQGYGPDVRHRDLAEVAFAVEAGAFWAATNTDATLPTNRGIAPGNGTLVAAVARAVGRDPDVVAGKPGPPLYRLAAERLGLEAERVLAVGDRLDTDVEGAVRAGMDSLLVLTGVDDVDAALRADGARRPTFLAPDLRWLHRDPERGDPSLAEVTQALTAAHEGGDGGAADTGEARESVRALLGRMSDR